MEVNYFKLKKNLKDNKSKNELNLSTNNQISYKMIQNNNENINYFISFK